jgi:enamine deaminase RidA (YjgF/YER057c/UK114 family)
VHIEERLVSLGISLPSPVGALGNYAPWVIHGDILYLSGVGGSSPIFGHLGAEVSVEDGYKLAREAALNHVATMKAALGDLDRVIRIIRVTGYISSAPEFGDHPKVVNGVTDLYVEIFGDSGRPARAAVGMASLPFNIPVEIETMVAIRVDA